MGPFLTFQINGSLFLKTKVIPKSIMLSLNKEALVKKDHLNKKPKRKSKHETCDKEKLDRLYKKVEKSAFNGQKPTSQSSIEKRPVVCYM